MRADKGREAILYFEQVRSFFLQASPAKRAPEFPVRIVAFRGEKQYQAYRLNDFAIAYYTQSRSHDYIVIQHTGELKHDFACGPQKPFQVAVDYAVLPDAKLGTVGIVRSLEF